MIEGGLQTFGVACGQLIGYGFYFVKGQKQWRVPVGIQLVPALIVAVFINFLPESPRWLVKYGLFDEASGVSLNEYQIFSNKYRPLTTCPNFEVSPPTTQFLSRSATPSSLPSKRNPKWRPSPTKNYSRTAKPRLCTASPSVLSSKPLSS
jgi:MFS family permease